MINVQNWTEKYRPSSLNEIVGNGDAIKELKKWGTEWKEKIPKKRAIIIAGKPGIGKTSAAVALANDFNWEIIELNASDDRNREKIRKVATSGALNETIANSGEYIPSRKKLIVLDEADNLYEREGDRGGKGAIIETIKETKQPIILIVNDYYSLIKGEGRTLKGICKLIKFKRAEGILNLLYKISKDEGIKVHPDVLRTIADRCDNDIRSAINDLQSISQGRKEVGKSDIYYRDRKVMIFDGVRKILKSMDFTDVRKIASNLDESPDYLLLWIDENLPIEYRNGRDLANGYKFLSKADVFLGRIARRQNYRLWAYASDLMTGGVALAKERPYLGFNRYNFPSWLKKMGGSKATRKLRNEISKKIGNQFHFSSKKGLEMLPSFISLFERDRELAAKMAMRMDLTGDEIAFLIGDDKVERVMEDMEKIRGKEKEMPLEVKSEPKEEPSVKEQKSLLDF